jgi:hypothetical protein
MGISRFAAKKRITPNQLQNKKDSSYNVVLITSKIYISSTAYRHLNYRSIYTPKERFQQNLKTIKSIKQYIPNYYIVLFDNSIFTNEERKILTDETDLFINIVDNENLNHFTDKSVNKSYGEIAQTYHALRYIQKLDIKNFFKITGRYQVNQNFDYSKFNNEYNIFKKLTIWWAKNACYTCFYKISQNNIKDYINVFNELYLEIQSGDEIYYDVSFEDIFPNRIEYKLIDTLGVIENIGIEYDINYI